MLKEFKEFALKGNVLDLAIAVIIGGAFGKVVTSFVNDILMPPLGLFLGKVDFVNLFINLSDRPFATLKEAKAAGAPVLSYGVFINTVIDFILIAFAIFLMVRWINRLKKQPEPPAPNTKPCSYCCTAIPLNASRCPNCTSELAG